MTSLIDHGSAGLAATSMTKPPAHRTRGWRRAQGGPTFRTTGFVLNAAHPRATSTWWSASCKIQSLAQHQARRRFQFGDGLLRVEHLDGGHAHVARRLQVDAEIVEIDGRPRIDVQRLDHLPVDARIGFPQADLGGLDDMI